MRRELRCRLGGVVAVQFGQAPENRVDVAVDKSGVAQFKKRRRRYFALFIQQRAARLLAIIQMRLDRDARRRRVGGLVGDVRELLGEPERVVRADVARAGQQFESEYAGEDELEGIREEIGRALFSALNAHKSAGVHYVQGLHDVATVLAFADRCRANRDESGVGDGVCAAILERVFLWHARDHTRKSISGTMEMVAMLADLTRIRDAELAAKLRSVPPFYAVSWFVCWFLHRVDRLEIAVRLLDAFIASHPLFPVYVGAALIEARREDILAESKDELDVLSTMNDMRVSDPESSVDKQLEQVQALIERALRIYEENPPEKTFRFARNSAATRYPYPWHPEAKSRAHIERAPLGDDVVPYDGSRRWPVCAFDNVRAAVRVRRLRKRGLYAARYDKTVAWVIVTEFLSLIHI